jgi:hypothetical protein
MPRHTTAVKAGDVVLTAGHCGENGSTWAQDYFDDQTGILYNTGLMGFTESVQWGDNRMDAEYVSPSGAIGVAGSGSLNVGDSICADGSFTNESCNGYVFGINACLDLNDEGHTSSRLQPGPRGSPR